jgi:hypothetical protein
MVWLHGIADRQRQPQRTKVWGATSANRKGDQHALGSIAYLQQDLEVN